MTQQELKRVLVEKIMDKNVEIKSASFSLDGRVEVKMEESHE